jgi:hypothetical protein
MSQFYQTAAQLLDQLLKKKATIKSAVFSNHGQDTKRMHKVLCETLRCNLIPSLIVQDKEPITAILQQSQIEKMDKMVSDTGKRPHLYVVNQKSSSFTHFDS